MEETHGALLMPCASQKPTTSFTDLVTLTQALTAGLLSVDLAFRPIRSTRTVDFCSQSNLPVPDDRLGHENLDKGFWKVWPFGMK